MALGIALSSMDVVVGISGVHYVTQGLRQIDRELDATNAKKVKVALEFPDVQGQLANIHRAGLLTTSSLADVGRELGALGRLSTQLAANPIRVMNARATINEAQQATAQAAEYRRQVVATQQAVATANNAAVQAYNNTRAAAQASVQAAAANYRMERQNAAASMATARTTYDAVVTRANGANAAALGAFRAAQQAARQADADVQMGVQALRQQQAQAILAGNAVRTAMATASAATRQATLDTRAYNAALRDEGSAARDLARITGQQQNLMRANAVLATQTPVRLAQQFTQGTVTGIKAARVLGDPTASLAAQATAAQAIRDNVDAQAFRNAQKSAANLREINRLQGERVHLQGLLTFAQGRTQGAQLTAQGSTQGAVAAQRAVALAQANLAHERGLVNAQAGNVANLRATAQAARAHQSTVGQVYNNVRVLSAQAVATARTTLNQTRAAIQTHLGSVAATVQTARTTAQQAVAGAQAQYRVIQQGGVLAINQAQNVARAAAQRAAALLPAARAAGQYLASLPIIANPIGTIFNVITGFIGGAAQIAGGLVNVGRGIFNLGASALGAVGHVASFAMHLLQIPAIAGPLTGGISLIADNFGKLATSIALVVGALAALSFKEVIQEGMAFEQAMADVHAVAQYSFLVKPEGAPAGSTATAGSRLLDVNGLTEAMKELDYITLKLGADTVFSNTEVASAIEFLIRGGTSVKDISEISVKSLLNLATATGGSIESSAGAINDLLGIFSLSADQIPHAANIIAGAVNTSRMDLTDWTNAMRQVAPLASSIGISFEDIATGLTLLGQKGFRGELAGTAFRNMLLYINPRSEPAKQELKDVGLWTDTGMSPIDPEDPNVIAFFDKKRSNERRLTQLRQQLAQQQSAAKPNQSAILSTQNQIQTLQDQLAHATPPTSKATGHSKFYDDMGNLRPLEEIIQMLADVSQGMSDVEKSQFYQKVFGTRSGSAALLFSKDDAKTFQETKDLIGSLDVQTLANFKLDTVAGAIELLTGSLKSLASVVFVNWLASPLKSFIMGMIPPVNQFLEAMGRVQKGNNLSELFGEKTRGQMGADQLGLQLTTGNFEAFRGNITAIFPELARFQRFLWPVFRTLQLGRDTLITFAQAFRGEWGGAVDSGINSVVRLAGVWGTYWGSIWRTVVALVKGDIDFGEFSRRLVKGFMGLLTDLATTLGIEGPKLWVALKAAFGLGQDLVGSLWANNVKPGLDTMLANLGAWIQANRGAMGKDIEGFIHELLFGRQAKSQDLRKSVMLDLPSTADPLALPPSPKEDTGGLFGLVGGFLSGLGGLVQDHRDDIIGAGKALGQLLLDGFDLLWADEGAGLGRHLARGLANAFSGLGQGIMSVNTGANDMWSELFNPGSTGGKKGATGPPDTGIGQEYKRAFLILAVDIMLIMDLIFSSMFNLILLYFKTLIQTLIDMWTLAFVGILKVVGKLPGQKDWTDSAIQDLLKINKQVQDGLDTNFPKVKPGATTAAALGGQNQLDTLLGGGEMVDANGFILTGPRRGQNVDPSKNVATVGGSGVAPGTTVVPGANGADSFNTPGKAPNNPRVPQRDPGDGGPNPSGPAPVTAGNIIIEARGLGVDQFIDELYLKLQARFQNG